MLALRRLDQRQNPLRAHFEDHLLHQGYPIPRGFLNFSEVKQAGEPRKQADDPGHRQFWIGIPSDDAFRFSVFENLVSLELTFQL